MADAVQGALTTGLASQPVITDGNWHRIAFTWDGKRRWLYVDGELVAEDIQAGMAECLGSSSIGTGKTMAPGTFWTGLIDDIQPYGRVVMP